jgi:hypothetical protein
MFPDVLGVGKQVSFSYYTTKLSCDLRYVCVCVCVCVCGGNHNFAAYSPGTPAWCFLTQFNSDTIPFETSTVQ